MSNGTQLLSVEEVLRIHDVLVAGLTSVARKRRRKPALSYRVAAGDEPSAMIESTFINRLTDEVPRDRNFGFLEEGSPYGGRGTVSPKNSLIQNQNRFSRFAQKHIVVSAQLGPDRVP